jgi:oligopeptide/dipeptide ABC transporter ATP-binding protein
MKLPRRAFLHLAASATVAPGRVADRKCANLSDATSSRNRRLCRWWPERHIRAPDRSPDGLTLLHASAANTVNAAVYDNLNFDPIPDIALVASIALTQAVPVKTVPEFIAYAKANPGKINMAMAGVDLVPVPHRGKGPALIDLMGGQDMKARYGLTLLFISHDLAVVKNISDRVAVMYLGRLCELAPSARLYEAPLHHYTAALMAAIPVMDPDKRRDPSRLLVGELPSPVNPPSGCRFRTQCPRAAARCAEHEPKWREVEPDHFVACHFPLGSST